MPQTLKYGLNPQQVEATVDVVPGAVGDPVQVLNGTPSYINYLDALNAWGLVRDLDSALGSAAAASFKHVSPAGVGVDGDVDDVMTEAYGVSRDGLSPVARAYVRARDADPKCSYGDFVAVSRTVDVSLASVLAGLFSDGIIAPGYDDDALATLRGKKGGAYIVLKADRSFIAPPSETRDVHGMRLTQTRDTTEITPDLVREWAPTDISEAEVTDVVIGLITLRYTQSNSVCFVRNGMTIGIGAGQQSRVDCTKLAGSKADTWWLRRHPKVRGLAFRDDVRRAEKINWQVRCIEGDLTGREWRSLNERLSEPVSELEDAERRQWVEGLSGVTFLSDGFLPFADNVEHAARHGVNLIAEPGGSVRAGDVETACEELNIRLIKTGLRLFHH